MNPVPIKLLIMEGALVEPLKMKSCLNNLINSDETQFQIMPVSPPNKVLQHLTDDHSPIIFTELSKLDPKSPETLKQIVRESPDISLFVRTDRNNQEFFPC